VWVTQITRCASSMLHPLSCKAERQGCSTHPRAERWRLGFLAAGCAWVCYAARTYSDYNKGAVVLYVHVHVHARGTRCHAIVHQLGDE
jgi:hypothetical protein